MDLLLLKRRSKVVGVFPNPTSMERLLGTVRMEIDEGWQAADRRYLIFGAEAKPGADHLQNNVAAAESGDALWELHGNAFTPLGNTRSLNRISIRCWNPESSPSAPQA